jgi:hypothetical protein
MYLLFIIFFYFYFFIIYFFDCVAVHAFFFENYGLGLGLALFRLGTRVGPVTKKNLVWFGNFSKSFVQS